MVLLTRHLALRKVAGRLTARRIEADVLTTVDGLRRQFGIARPSLVICGLNPHAGEHGTPEAGRHDLP